VLNAGIGGTEANYSSGGAKKSEWCGYGSGSAKKYQYGNASLPKKPVKKDLYDGFDSVFNQERLSP
jgi:hypothetical protein